MRRGSTANTEGRSSGSSLVESAVELTSSVNMTVSWRRSTPKAIKPFWTIQDECRNLRPDPPNEFCQSVAARLARPIAQARRRCRSGHGREVSASLWRNAGGVDANGTQSHGYDRDRRPVQRGRGSRVVIITGDDLTSVPKITDTATKSAWVELAAKPHAARDLLTRVNFNDFPDADQPRYFNTRSKCDICWIQPCSCVVATFS